MRSDEAPRLGGAKEANSHFWPRKHTNPIDLLKQILQILLLLHNKLKYFTALRVVQKEKTKPRSEQHSLIVFLNILQ